MGGHGGKEKMRGKKEEGAGRTCIGGKGREWMGEERGVKRWERRKYRERKGI